MTQTSMLLELDFPRALGISNSDALTPLREKGEGGCKFLHINTNSHCSSSILELSYLGRCTTSCKYPKFLEPRNAKAKSSETAF